MKYIILLICVKKFILYVIVNSLLSYKNGKVVLLD